MTVTPLNTLPTIIKEPGEYITRSGCRVTIHEIKPTLNTPTDNGRTEFRAKGTIYVPDRKAAKRGVTRFIRVYNAWHISGRNLPIHESTTDIVGVWIGPLDAVVVEAADE